MMNRKDSNESIEPRAGDTSAEEETAGNGVNVDAASPNPPLKLGSQQFVVSDEDIKSDIRESAYQKDLQTRVTNPQDSSSPSRPLKLSSQELGGSNKQETHREAVCQKGSPFLSSPLASLGTNLQASSESISNQHLDISEHTTPPPLQASSTIRPSSATLCIPGAIRVSGFGGGDAYRLHPQLTRDIESALQSSRDLEVDEQVQVQPGIRHANGLAANQATFADPVHLLEATLVDNVHVEATPVHVNANAAITVDTNTEAEKKQDTNTGSSRCNKKKLTVSAMIVVLLVLPVAALMVYWTLNAGDKDANKDAPSAVEPPPTRRPPFADAEMLDSFVLKSITSDPYSPQALANEWMWDDPNLHNYSTERQIQRFMLATVWYAMGGDKNNWKRTDNWMNYNVSECEWYSAHPSQAEICNSDDNMLTIFNMTNNGLLGTIPHEMILYFESSKIWDLSHNSLHGSVPAFSKSMVAMEVLDMSYNQLTGSLAVDFGVSEFSFLKLNLRNNFLGGSIPEEVVFMPNVSHVDISNNQYFGKLPPYWAGLDQLVDLRVANNRMIGTLPAAMADLTNLRRLDMSGNVGLRGTIPEALGHRIHTLEVLDLRNTDITGAVPLAFCQKEMAGLLDLSLDACSSQGEVQCCPPL